MAAGREVQVQSCLTYNNSPITPPHSIHHFRIHSGGVHSVLSLIQGVFVTPSIDTVIPRRHTYPLRRLH
jgi:hypothetical protein